MNNMKWVRIDTDLPYHEKLRRIREMRSGHAMMLCWIWMILLCGKGGTADVLMQAPGIPHNVDSLALLMDFGKTRMTAFLNVFEREGMIRRDEKGIHICEWSERFAVLPEGMLGIGTEKEKQKEKENEKENEKEKVPQKEKDKVKVKVKAKVKAKEGNTESKRIDDDDACESGGLDPRQMLMGGTLGRGLVMLSEAQLTDLLSRLSHDEFEKYVDIVAGREEAGFHYRGKSHYQVILEMAERDRRIL